MWDSSHFRFGGGDIGAGPMRFVMVGLSTGLMILAAMLDSSTKKSSQWLRAVKFKLVRCLGG
jgi:hypothetical protein